MPCAVSGTITVVRAALAAICLKYALAISSAVEFGVRAGGRVERERGHAEERARLRSSSHMTASAPCASSSGANGCRSRNAGRFAIASLMRGLYFIVHEPSG